MNFNESDPNNSSQSQFNGLEIDALAFFSEDARQLNLLFSLDGANMTLHVFEQENSNSV